MTSNRRKVTFRLIAVIALVWFVLTLVVPLFWPWTAWNCHTESIDIAGGRYRLERYLYFVKWLDRIEETELSKRCSLLLGESPAPDWRPVNTFSPGRGHSPHYRHHGSLHAAKHLTKALISGRFDAEAEAKALVTFLGLLQADDDCFRASDYALSLLILAEDVESPHEITLDDLPPPPP